jgi:peptide/nickel transport system permease protein
MRLIDLLLAFPALLLAIMFGAVFGASTLTAMVAIGIATIPAFALIARAATLQVMSTDYVLAARVAGRPRLAIGLTHVLPNIGGLIIIQSSVCFGIAVLAEAALSFLGFGTRPPTPSWGRMLQESQELPPGGTAAGDRAGRRHRGRGPRLQPPRRRPCVTGSIPALRTTIDLGEPLR